MKFIAGAENVGKEIISKICDGILRIQSQESYDKFESSFIYDFERANKISFCEDDINIIPEEPRATLGTQQKGNDYESYSTVLQKYKPGSSRGQNPPPYEFLYECRNYKAVKQKVQEWKQQSEG